MTVFLCEDSFEGILCGVYDAWTSRLGHVNVALELCGSRTMRMFAEYRQVAVTEEKVEKVVSAIKEKIGMAAYEQVFRCSLSREEEKADRIYRFLIYGFHFGRQVTSMLQVPEVQAVFQMDRSVSHEACLQREFIRFSRGKQGILFAIMGPEHDVLLLIAPHFADRLSGENWIIYDEIRRKGAVHKAMEAWVVVKDEEEQLKNWFSGPDAQNGYEDLWRTYFDHIAIKERMNPKCQRNHLPLKFRPYMTEFQREGKNREFRQENF